MILTNKHNTLKAFHILRLKRSAFFLLAYSSLFLLTMKQYTKLKEVDTYII